MHIKFLTHGKGQAAKTVGYVTGSTDHRGILRKEVKLLRGNPSMVAQVVDSLRFSRVYTSGVIAWAPDDAPSDQEIEDVLDDFERLSFAGLDPDRVAWTVVLHREFGGGVHLHDKDEDKLLVVRDTKGTDLYFSLVPPDDGGSFSDFVRKKKALSVGEVRKRMRERKHDLSSSSTPAPPMSREWIENTVRAYRLNPYSGGVLESRWGLLPETVERFREQIREDDKGNVCFLHRNNKGVTGWEILGEDRIEFSERCTHSSFFVGKTGTRILRVVITESALEAMSYFQVRGKEGDCYLSLGGTISRKQLDSLREVGQRFRPVVMVTGGDERGRRLAEEIEREVPGLLQELPSSGRTWNEEIQEERGHSESDAFYRINP